MKKNDYSPIAIFTFNRPSHLKKLLNSLSTNEEIKYSDVYFFIDVDISLHLGGYKNFSIDQLNGSGSC